ncbi:MAG: hypothetical protein LBT00_08665 [Spirochaetaceae bacterium]|nr:hypothetical protein [Spirochaetaceae bacterium]
MGPRGDIPVIASEARQSSGNALRLDCFTLRVRNDDGSRYCGRAPFQNANAFQHQNANGFQYWNVPGGGDERSP